MKSRLSALMSRRRYKLNLPLIEKVCKCGCNTKFNTTLKSVRYIKGHYKLPKGLKQVKHLIKHNPQGNSKDYMYDYAMQRDG